MVPIEIKASSPQKIQTLNYRYLKDTQTIHLLMKPAATSRHIQYYTRYKPTLPPHGRYALYGFINKREVDIARVEHSANILTLDIGDAKLIANNLNIPLVVEVSSYCNLDDKSQVDEVFFYRCSATY